MYKFVDHFKCKHCGNTNTLFKLRVDAYEKKKTGNIVYVETSQCKTCYLESCRMKNDTWRSNPKNVEKCLRNQSERRKGNPHYKEMARKSYWKNRDKILEKKRSKYKSVAQHKKQIGSLKLFSRKRRIKYKPIPSNHLWRLFNLKRSNA